MKTRKDELLFFKNELTRIQAMPSSERYKEISLLLDYIEIQLLREMLE